MAGMIWLWNQGPAAPAAATGSAGLIFFWSRSGGGVPPEPEPPKISEWLIRARRRHRR